MIYLEKAVRLSPDLLDSEYIKEFLDKNQGIYQRLLVNIADSLKKGNSTSPILKSRLGKIQLHLADTTSAMKLWKEVVRDLPNMDRPWYNMALVKLSESDTSTFKRYLNRAILLDARDYLYSVAYGNFYYNQGRKKSAVYYYKNTLYRYNNLYSHYTMIAPRWYGYQTIPNNLLPLTRLKSIKPSLDIGLITARLIELYTNLGMDKERLLFEKYERRQITNNELFRELNKNIFN